MMQAALGDSTVKGAEMYVDPGLFAVGALIAVALALAFVGAHRPAIPRPEPLPPPKPAPIFVYKSADGFFKHWCEFGDNAVEFGKGMVAQVVDPTPFTGGVNPVYTDERGIQHVALRVVSDDGGFIVMAAAASTKGPKLKPDDLVIWVPGAHIPDLGKTMGDARGGYIGLVTATIDASWSIDGLQVVEEFTPAPLTER
ncbi:MAG: hypothetical protein QOH04_1532 [Sphingomonadales bacterium]|jgi:hypothetical protein|nr:hypothetical protein [Sphingomonadales bacterium]